VTEAKTMIPRVTLTVDELAAMLGVERKSLYSCVKRGKIPHIRIGRSIRFSRKRIERWLEEGGPPPRARR